MVLPLVSRAVAAVRVHALRRVRAAPATGVLRTAGRYGQETTGAPDRSEDVHRAGPPDR